MFIFCHGVPRLFWPWKRWFPHVSLVLVQETGSIGGEVAEPSGPCAGSDLWLASQLYEVYEKHCRAGILLVE